MTREESIQRLLDELLETDSTPEEVCRSQPELLDELREKWSRIKQLQNELDAWFPADHPEPKPKPYLRSDLPLISGYELEDEIGRGGMGVVYRAKHLRLKRTVAIKMAGAGSFTTDSQRKRFQREAEAVAAINHRNIVKVFDVGEAENVPYFSMELGDGGTLQDRIANGAMAPRESATITRDLACAIAAAHKAGIIHRDLKPSNVLIDASGEPKITDFGLARRLDDDDQLSRTGVPMGTPSYMAPEQASGRHEDVGTSVDIYALGAILYALLTSRAPFKSNSHAATIVQVIHSDPVPPSKLNHRVPRDLESICLKCLRKEPARRYLSATHLAEDLGRFTSGEAVHARPESSVGRLYRRFKRRPWASSLVLFLAIGVALLGTYQWSLSQRLWTEMQSRRVTATTHLDRATQFLEISDWREAKNELDRAHVTFGMHPPADLARKLSDLERLNTLGFDLEQVRLHGFTAIGSKLSFQETDSGYKKHFQELGVGSVGGDASHFVAEIRSSPIRFALISAIDHWIAFTGDSTQREWLLDVVRRADDDPTGWRSKIRDPAIWKNESELLELVNAEPNSKHSTPLLLAAEIRNDAPPETRLRFLQAVQQKAPADFWANQRLGIFLMASSKPNEAVAFFQAAVAIRPEVGYAHNSLGKGLHSAGRFEEAEKHLRAAIKLEPNVPAIRDNLLETLLALRKHDEILAMREIAKRESPKNALIRTIFGKSFEAKGKLEEAFAEHREASLLDPNHAQIQQEYRKLLCKCGRHEELFRDWTEKLESRPEQHDQWYGYAELALFLGHGSVYEHHRITLLGLFAKTKDVGVSERTARACLLTSLSGEQLDQVLALAGNAINLDRRSSSGHFVNFQFLRGFCAYRKGDFAEATKVLTGGASTALGPAPKLILAMIYHKTGNSELAAGTLKEAISKFDWRPENATDQDRWIFHILRREAEETLKEAPSAGTSVAKE